MAGHRGLVPGVGGVDAKIVASPQTHRAVTARRMWELSDSVTNLPAGDHVSHLHYFTGSVPAELKGQRPRRASWWRVGRQLARAVTEVPLIDRDAANPDEYVLVADLRHGDVGVGEHLRSAVGRRGERPSSFSCKSPFLVVGNAPRPCRSAGVVAPWTGVVRSSRSSGPAVARAALLSVG
jgi:hypothetical protein